jgi:hypothetical protein
MSLLATFEVVSGSTTGAAHRCTTPPGPNQDRVRTLVTTEGKQIVAVISDGCSSGSLSQIGAALTVDVLVTGIYNRLQSKKPLTRKWFKKLYWFLVESLWDDARLQLPTTQQNDIDAIFDVLKRRGQATANGFILDAVSGNLYRFGIPEVFGILNGNRFVWPAAKEHHAPYPAGAYHNRGEEHFGDFHVEVAPLDQLTTLMMGTDGVERLLAVCDTPKPFTGMSRPVGPIEQIFTRREFYADPDACNGWLNSLAAAGFLADDTSLVGVRRKEQ